MVTCAKFNQRRQSQKVSNCHHAARFRTRHNNDSNHPMTRRYDRVYATTMLRAMRWLKLRMTWRSSAPQPHSLVPTSLRFGIRY
jgi:hypothetical protein